MPTFDFYELLEEMKLNNIKLLDEDDIFIGKGASESHMLKMKLDMQLYSDNSTTTLETNADSKLYGMSFRIIKL